MLLAFCPCPFPEWPQANKPSCAEVARYGPAVWCYGVLRSAAERCPCELLSNWNGQGSRGGPSPLTETVPMHGVLAAAHGRPNLLDIGRILPRQFNDPCVDSRTLPGPSRFSLVRHAAGQDPEMAGSSAWSPGWRLICLRDSIRARCEPFPGEAFTCSCCVLAALSAHNADKFVLRIGDYLFARLSTGCRRDVVLGLSAVILRVS